jgi:tellurite resistance protein TehA-like permease
MKAVSVVRVYGVVLAGLLLGWSLNLYEALTRPKVVLGDAADFPLLVVIFLIFGLLVRARNELSADQAAHLRKGLPRYIIAVLTAAGLVTAVLLGASHRG